MAITAFILVGRAAGAVLGVVSLVVAMLLVLPWSITGIVLAFDRLQRSTGSTAAQLAVIELRSEASRARSLAIAATGAMAVFGSVAIQGAQRNLQHGLDESTHDLAESATLWVTAAGAQNLLATTPFSSAAAKVLGAPAGVQSVASLGEVSSTTAFVGSG